LFCFVFHLYIIFISFILYLFFFFFFFVFFFFIRCGIPKTCGEDFEYALDVERPYDAIPNPEKLHSRDYARILNLNLRFYECQWSGKAPEKKQVYWR